jgi:hypothetical protein
MASISEHNIFLANSVEAPSLVDETPITQVEVLDATDVANQPVVSTPDMVVKVNFISVGTESDSQRSVPVIRQAQEILTVSIESTAEVTTNTVNQSQTLGAVDTTSTSSLAPRPVIIELKPLGQDTTRTLLVPSESRTTIVGRAA